MRIAGVPVDRGTPGDAVRVIADAIAGDRVCRVLVANANKAWLARRDARLRAALDAAELVVPEWAMVWAARRLGIRGVRFIAGIELMRRLLREADARGWSVYLLGARPAVVEALAVRLEREHPALRVSGHHHGYLDARLEERVLAELDAKRPDLLFVAMGSPRQERFIARLPDGVGARVRIGVGGSFDVLAGAKRDTPDWARGNGLEWLYRTLQDPWRLGRRYAVINPWFVAAVLRERWLKRARAR